MAIGAVAVVVAVGVGGGVAVAVVVGVVVVVGVAGRPEMIHDEWRHRAHAADDLLSDIAAVCRGEMPPEPREGGSEAHRAAWIAVCALRSEVAAERAARDEARRMLAECTVLSGADTDRNTVESGWVHLWRRAVDDVSQLRADYNDHSDIERAERERDEARAEVERLRGEVSYLRACVPPVHPADYGHEAWSAALRDSEARGWQGMRAEAAEWARLLVEAKKKGARSAVAERAAERAAVVAWLRDEVDDDDNAEGPLASILAYAANAIESGEHRNEGDK